MGHAEYVLISYSDRGLHPPDPRRRYPVGRVEPEIAEYVLISYSDRGLHPRTPAGDILWAG
ncbi:MAG: hypothetical protein APR55_11925 [Methanolinea sp. SDB]|nr:MAG: hypothetical protein APR55_11925 [Methanolinea sp. SDB]